MNERLLAIGVGAFIGALLGNLIWLIGSALI